MKYRDSVSIACVNFETVWGEKSANLRKIENIAVEAAKQGNNIVVFPELALSGYECDETDGTKGEPCRMHKNLAEYIPGPSTAKIELLAKKLDIYIVFGMPEKDHRDTNILYISTAVVGPQGLLGAYRKLHLAPLPRFTECLCFKAGDQLPVWETRYGIMGVLICYDFFFYPELARIMALKGADILINTSASGSGPGKALFIVQQTGCRATENGVYAASANLVGKERNNTYYGHSVIAGPSPSRPSCIFAEGEENEEIVCATLSLKRLRARRAQLDWKTNRQTALINREFNRI